MTPGAAAALETKGLAKNFGALTVARDIDFRLDAGARHALIGPNGAGKTTFINLITGRLAPTAGRVFLAGADVTDLGQAARVKRGLARTFQITTLFKGLSALENVTLAIRERDGIAARLFRPAGAWREAAEEAFRLLADLGLTDEVEKPIKELAYGRQRLVEIALALALKPKVLLLDEPAAGVPADESALIFRAIEALPADIAVLIIEHDMEIVFRFAKRITVLVQGQVLREGAPADIAADPEVRAVYLGEAHHG